MENIYDGKPGGSTGGGPKKCPCGSGKPKKRCGCGNY